MTELELKYGCNPNQKPARIFMEEGDLPLKVLNGRPGYINFMDALNSWQLVKALKKATGLSPIARAYIRARGADRLCSFGDWAALSDVCDGDTARFLAAEVSDGVIAPGYTDEALDILKAKRKGGYNVVEIDPNYEPAPIERRNIFGITFEQGYNSLDISEEMLQNIVTENKDLPQQAKHDMLLSLITLKYTQSNSVCYVKDGMTIGVGVGQQSRIHCTRLAGSKADIWWLRQHPKVLGLQFVDNIRRPDRDNAIDLYISDEYEDVLAEGVWQNTFQVKPEVLTAEEKAAWIAQMSGVTVGSDAFFPFGDNVERARKSGVQYIAQPGGSIRDDQVIATANKYGMVMAFTGMPKSLAFAKRIVFAYRYLSEEKKEYVLSKQMLRSGTSIGANIAEAQYGSSRKDFLNKLYIALKECAETLYWLELLYSCDYISRTEYDSLHSDCEELRKLLSSITKSVRDGTIPNS